MRSSNLEPALYQYLAGFGARSTLRRIAQGSLRPRVRRTLPAVLDCTTKRYGDAPRALGGRCGNVRRYRCCAAHAARAGRAADAACRAQPNHRWRRARSGPRRRGDGESRAIVTDGVTERFFAGTPPRPPRAPLHTSTGSTATPRGERDGRQGASASEPSAPQVRGLQQPPQPRERLPQAV